MKLYFEVLASRRLNMMTALYVKNERMIMPTNIEKQAPNNVLNDSSPAYVILMFMPKASNLRIKSKMEELSAFIFEVRLVDLRSENF